jgi:cytosine/creatinine deaminase
MDALERAGRQPAHVYLECTLYTTLWPCAMCSGSILLYGIPRVIIGENRTFMGEEELLRSRGVGVQVLQDPACVARMERFIAAHSELWNEDIGEPKPNTYASAADFGISVPSANVGLSGTRKQTPLS